MVYCDNAYNVIAIWYYVIRIYNVTIAVIKIIENRHIYIKFKFKLPWISLFFLNKRRQHFLLNNVHFTDFFYPIWKFALCVFNSILAIASSSRLFYLFVIKIIVGELKNYCTWKLYTLHNIVIYSLHLKIFQLKLINKDDAS